MYDESGRYSVCIHTDVNCASNFLELTCTNCITIILLYNLIFYKLECNYNDFNHLDRASTIELKNLTLPLHKINFVLLCR